MSIQNSVSNILTAPTVAGLWRLRGDVLQAGVPPEASIWPTLDRFFEFLNEISAALSAREYSQLASLMDIGAVGGVALESILETNSGQTDLWKRILLGALSESLMILASRQYIKAFQAETKAIYRAAGWHLQQELWQLSVLAQPELDPAGRRQVIDKLLSPAFDENVSDTLKAVLLGRLFLALMLVQLNMSLSQLPSDE